MVNNTEWFISIECKCGCEDELKTLKRNLYLASMNDGTNLVHFIESTLRLSASSLDVIHHSKGANNLGILSVMSLPKELWNKGMSLSKGSYIKSAHLEGDSHLVLSFYGPDSQKEFISFVVENCDYIKDYNNLGILEV